MPTGLKRFQQTNQLHFITFSCYKRQPFLHTEEAKDTVQQILEQTRKQQGLRIAAYVLMPEHVHLLTNEPATGTLAQLHPDPEATNLPKTQIPRAEATLASPLLRLQRIEFRKAHR